MIVKVVWDKRAYNGFDAFIITLELGDGRCIDTRYECWPSRAAEIAATFKDVIILDRI